MGLDIDPAALGGLAGLIALASWAVGLMQGGGRAPPLPFAAAGAALEPDTSERPESAGRHLAAAAVPVTAAPPCQQRAFAQRRELLTRPAALAELHDEVCAIRRGERIFESCLEAEAPMPLAVADRAASCRYPGVSGGPSCPGPRHQACDNATGCGGLAASGPGAAMPDRC
jgi:hypothetical protein